MYKESVSKLLSYCSHRAITDLEGRCFTLECGKVIDDRTLIDIGNKYNKTNTQVALRWLIQQNVVAIPSSKKELHAQQNFDIFDFYLSDEDMATIKALRSDKRLVSPKELAPEWDTNPYSN